MATTFPLSLTKLVLTSATIALLASCASPQKKSQTKTVTKVIQQQPEAEQASIKTLLEQAKAAEQDNATALLIEAAQLANEQALHKKALWLAGQTIPITDQIVQRYQLLVIQAEALSNLGEFTKAYEKIELAHALEQKNRINHSYHYWMVRYQILTNRGIDEEALASLIQASYLRDGNIETARLIWQKLSQLSRWQLEYLQQMSLPRFDGWYQLVKLGGQYAGDYQLFNQHVDLWRSKNPQHTANLVLDEINSVETNLSTNIKNVAVILPLSGPHKTAGQVAQQGILAAYEKLPNTVLSFIDSQQTDFSTLNQSLIESETDAVIGPLLKESVEKYISQEQISLPTLLLNTVNSALPEKVSAISMRPEDEAIQAATTLAARSYKHPLVLSHQDSISERITNTFVEQWFKNTGYRPQVVRFSKDSKMQTDLKTALEVQQSEDRIKKLNERISETIKVDERNRRDIDMVYLVGKPIESRIAKPYIDVNIAPFADFIPVYASSRSHNGNADKSEMRDLNGLIFTEMPWLLASEEQDESVANAARTLWPSRSDSLSRIFAMGYDSYQLIFKLQHMKTHPVLRHVGQTGIIMRKDNGLLTRSLLWGKYYTDRVENIEMEHIGQKDNR